MNYILLETQSTLFQYSYYHNNVTMLVYYKLYWIPRKDKIVDPVNGEQNV